ncbi:KTSC domain-containing protein [Acinetobacter bereziniae]|uniref:KTSC domain-containing protein n=1 Tax=Acinetobacter bereziniae TaxID=106648 RepID=UPI00300B2FF7
MERKIVVSSNIRSIGYDSFYSRLEVEFLNGSIYQYFYVPSDLYIGLMNAGSHGEFLDVYIKKGGYAYIQIR